MRWTRVLPDPERKNRWHQWYAWRPVFVQNTWVWRETIWRRKWWYPVDNTRSAHACRWMYDLPEGYMRTHCPS